MFLLKILKTLFLVNFMTLLSLLSKMFFLAFLSLSILVSVFYIMFYVHICLCMLIDCHCNDCMLPAWRIKLRHKLGYISNAATMSTVYCTEQLTAERSFHTIKLHPVKLSLRISSIGCDAVVRWMFVRAPVVKQICG